MTKRTPFLAGLFLICMSTLMLQIIQTRILSVVSMYYLAFLSISMAMLGMTAGALFVYFRLGGDARNVSDFPVAGVRQSSALTTSTCFILQLASPLAVVRVATTLVIWMKVLVLLAAPFAVAGVAVSLALTRSPFATGLTYGVDLVGAAFGCLVVLLLLNTIDASSAMFVVAALAAFAGVLSSGRRSNAPPDLPCSTGDCCAGPGWSRSPCWRWPPSTRRRVPACNRYQRSSTASRSGRRSISKNGIPSRGSPGAGPSEGPAVSVGAVFDTADRNDGGAFCAEYRWSCGDSHAALHREMRRWTF